jgi:PTH1 family peptidyl-tRNA hydrolase
MKLVVGLGNPGPEYAFTRHNMGWQVVDALVARHRPGTPKLRFRGTFWDSLSLAGQRVLLLKPLTYMNLSGFSVREAVSFYKIEFQDLLVIFDDVALPFGRLRLRAQGSAGGQKGMISILGALGTLEVPRLRVGVGAPERGRDLAGWVTRSLPPECRAELDQICSRGCDAVDAWLTESFDRAMSRVNRPDPEGADR